MNHETLWRIQERAHARLQNHLRERPFGGARITTDYIDWRTSRWDLMIAYRQAHDEFRDSYQSREDVREERRRAADSGPGID